MMVGKRFLSLGPALPNEAHQGRSHPKWDRQQRGKECLLSPMCPLDGAWSPHCWGKVGDWLCFGECGALHFSQDMHLGHSCRVALVYLLLLCLITPPGAQIFAHIFQSRKLRQEKVRDVPKVTCLVHSGVNGHRLL